MSNSPLEAASNPPSQASSPSALATSFPQQQHSLPQRALANAASARSNLPSSPATPASPSPLLEPPPNTRFADFLHTWTDHHVQRWLADIKCAHHATTFKNNDIRSDVLLELDQATLKEIGIASIGDRLRILNAVKALRAKANPRRDSVLSHTSLRTLTIPDGLPASPAPRSPVSSRRIDHGRPPPLQLSSNHQNGSALPLPHLVRDGIRPLPYPHPTLSIPSAPPISQSNTPSSSHPSRSNHFPPAPRTQPPAPPSAAARQQSRFQPPGRTPTQEAPDYTSLPLPPAPASSADRSLLTPVSAQPSSWTPYGLPSDPRAGRSPRSQSPLPGSGSGVPAPTRQLTYAPGFNPSRSPNPAAHGRNLSASSVQTGTGANAPTTTKLGARPATAGNAPVSSSSSSSSSSHPYALTPGTAGAQSSGAANNALSPIAESFANGSAFSPGSAVTPGGAASAFTVGRGPFPARPGTPGSHGTPSLVDLRRKLLKFQLPAEGHSATINVEDCAGGVEVLERALKKFGKLGARVPGDAGGGGGGDSFTRAGTEDGGLSVDGWGVYFDWGRGDDGPSTPLSEAQLLAVCHSKPDDPIRERGLILRHTSRGGGARRNKAHAVLGATPPLSPIQTANPDLLDPEDDRLGPYGAVSRKAQTQAQTQTGRATKRASTISVLSGLGVPFPEKAMDSPWSSDDGLAQYANLPQHHQQYQQQQQQQQSQQPVPPASASGTASKVRNFFGHRPPSELITNHLREYFPGADRKMLKRTSVLRAGSGSGSGTGGGRRDSTWSFNAAGAGSASARASKRFSVSTVGSGARGASRRTSVSSFAPVPLPAPYMAQEAPPRVSLSTEDGRSFDIAAEDGEGADEGGARAPTPGRGAPALPPVELSAESLAETLSASLAEPRARPRPLSTGSKRLSYVTELRPKKDNSDAASMMTVDEITEQVESRRTSRNADAEADTASMIEGWTKVEGGADEEVTEQTPVTPTDVPPEEEDVDGEYDEDEDDEDDDDDDDDDDMDEEDEEVYDEEDADADEDGVGRANEANGIKWIKGALIGSGSFGKVYLGMDATNGLLMAVKQVELSGSMNNDRKRSMVDALEREIELLKDLEHENIVQYLYSSSDEDHFNIFLEYVPGGSVAALLRNYGAFEEPLVRNFVRQILEGLDYVHERGIVHRDIKGANVLVDNKGGIKISDFGISKKLEDNLMPGNRLHRPSLQGSVFWMAPEVVKQTAYTKKADVWSVGCLVVEMFTGEHPWAQLNQMQAIFKIGSFSAKPPIPHDVSADAQAFLELCFELDHEARPSAGELLKHAWLAKKPVVAKGRKDVS